MRVIKQHLENTHNRPKRIRKKTKAIVIHYTANYNKGANAKANIRYIQNTDRYASAHYFIDDTGIYEAIPSHEVAWHVGAKRYTKIGQSIKESGYSPNYFTIGIEMCVNSDSDFEVTREKTIELAAKLMSDYNVTIDNIFRHYDITGKNCPAMYVKDIEGWNKFKKDLLEEYNKLDVDSDSTNDDLHNERVTITATELNIRSKPTIDSKIIGKLKLYDEVTVYDMENGFYALDEGYISAMYTDEIDIESFEWERKVNTKYEITVDKLNIRQGAGTHFRTFEQYNKGDIVEVEEIINDTWALTDKGYIHTNYIKEI